MIKYSLLYPISKPNKQKLGLWAAGCATHVLSLFEKQYPTDKRPRNAIKELKKCVRTGKFSMKTIRKASLSAHAAARKAKPDSAARFAARFAARAAGQAVATAHVAAHALAAANYAIKAANAAGRTGERAWQEKRLPRHLKVYIKKLHVDWLK